MAIGDGHDIGTPGLLSQKFTEVAAPNFNKDPIQLGQNGPSQNGTYKVAETTVGMSDGWKYPGSKDIRDINPGGREHDAFMQWAAQKKGVQQIQMPGVTIKQRGM